MAEAAGLAIGTVALVGAFKDCIDVYGMIVAARSLTDDAEALKTKFDVERLLLLQWADRVGLAEPESYDKRLDDPDLNSAIVRVLQHIKRLLSDGKALRDQYGLVDDQVVRHRLVLDDNLSTRAGSTRSQKFIERFNSLALQTVVARKEQSVTTCFKWVVKDKEKFASLTDKLSYFVSRLNDLIPAQEQPDRTTNEQDLARMRGIPQYESIYNAAPGLRPQRVVSQQATRSLKQKRVLNRLWFRLIDDRKAIISERHTRTLEWALEPCAPTLKWDPLGEWLKTGSGLYWLAGKPGTGKSTLMKYLSDHPRTISLLEEWAGHSELVTLRFFFYGLGQAEQKSQEGILRSLLFQFLDRYRDLIEPALPAMWKEAVITQDDSSVHALTMPSISEMQTSFLNLAGVLSADRKIWILIDGLDEFEGKHSTITAFLSSLTRLQNIKILVSSRQLPIFAGAFNDSPKMYLQDLTNGGIEAYIDEMLLNNAHMAQIARIDPDIPMKIAKVVTGKASWVFLWVALACRSILEGLDDYETVPELMSRISELPSELDDFFRRIIAGVNPRHRDQCARLLRLVFESQRVRALDPLPAIGLAIVEEQGLRADFTRPSVARLSGEQLALRCHMLEGRLGSRCYGLVELQRGSDYGMGHSLHGIADMAPEDVSLVNSDVVFMHRSLYEFLCTEGIWEWDVLRVDDTCGVFEPHTILTSLWIQVAGLLKPVASTVQGQLLINALIHNAHAEAAKCPPELLATSFLSRLQSFFARGEWSTIFRDLARVCLPAQSKRRKGNEDVSAGLAFAAELGMSGLVQFANEGPGVLQPSTCSPGLYSSGVTKATPKSTISATGFPLLYHAICRPALSMLQLITGRYRWVYRVITPSAEVVKYLVQKGHDPNEGFVTQDGPTTPWIEWLDLIRPGGSNNRQKNTLRR